jgi:hypothetical protein
MAPGHPTREQHITTDYADRLGPTNEYHSHHTIVFEYSEIHVGFGRSSRRRQQSLTSGDLRQIGTSEATTNYEETTIFLQSLWHLGFANTHEQNRPPMRPRAKCDFGKFGSS